MIALQAGVDPHMRNREYLTHIRAGVYSSIDLDRYGRAWVSDGGGARRIMKPSLDDGVGLCATCVHAQIVASSKGSTFHLCRKSETDDRFPRYPVLPVRRCAGYEALAPAD